MKTKLSLILAAALTATAAVGAATVRIVQTNAAGDSVMLIDPETNKVVLTVDKNYGSNGKTSNVRYTHFSLLKVVDKFGWTEGKEFEFVPLGGINDAVPVRVPLIKSLAFLPLSAPLEVFVRADLAVAVRI